jgi:uncharacterized protein with NAD-binding domain and iron-sulfur cluster
MSSKFDVVIIGGGISGLVSAHELVEKGLKVCVIEKEGVVGGKPLAWFDSPFQAPPNSTSQTSTDVKTFLSEPSKKINSLVPVEHAFRVYPNNYVNLLDIMDRIPHPDGGIVSDYLTNDIIAAPNIDKPLPNKTIKDKVLSLLEVAYLGLSLYTPYLVDEQKTLTKYDKISFGDLVNIDKRSPGTKELIKRISGSISSGSTKVISSAAVTNILGNYINAPQNTTFQTFDRPTQKAWLEPWETYLTGKGVTFFKNSEIKKFNFLQSLSNEDTKTSISSVSFRDTRDPLNSTIKTVMGNYYICALPVDALQRIINNNLEMIRYDNKAINLLKIVTLPATGFQLYYENSIKQLNKEIFVGSLLNHPWEITWIDQTTYWNKNWNKDGVSTTNRQATIGQKTNVINNISTLTNDILSINANNLVSSILPITNDISTLIDDINNNIKYLKSSIVDVFNVNNEITSTNNTATATTTNNAPTTITTNSTATTTTTNNAPTTTTTNNAPTTTNKNNDIATTLLNTLNDNISSALDIMNTDATNLISMVNSNASSLASDIGHNGLSLALIVANDALLLTSNIEDFVNSIDTNSGLSSLLTSITDNISKFKSIINKDLSLLQSNKISLLSIPNEDKTSVNKFSHAYIHSHRHHRHKNNIIPKYISTKPTTDVTVKPTGYDQSTTSESSTGYDQSTQPTGYNLTEDQLQSANKEYITTNTEASTDQWPTLDKANVIKNLHEHLHPHKHHHKSKNQKTTTTTPVTTNTSTNNKYNDGSVDTTVPVVTDDKYDDGSVDNSTTTSVTMDDKYDDGSVDTTTTSVTTDDGSVDTTTTPVVMDDKYDDGSVDTTTNTNDKYDDGSVDTTTTTTTTDDKYDDGSVDTTTPVVTRNNSKISTISKPKIITHPTSSKPSTNVTAKPAINIVHKIITRSTKASILPSVSQLTQSLSQLLPSATTTPSTTTPSTIPQNLNTNYAVITIYPGVTNEPGRTIKKPIVKCTDREIAIEMFTEIEKELIKRNIPVPKRIGYSAPSFVGPQIYRPFGQGLVTDEQKAAEKPMRADDTNENVVNDCRLHLSVTDMWKDRPEGTDFYYNNMILAGAYTKNYNYYVSTMESAAESGKRAANTILVKEGLREIKIKKVPVSCTVKAFRTVDKILSKYYLPNPIEVIGYYLGKYLDTRNINTSSLTNIFENIKY